MKDKSKKQQAKQHKNGKEIIDLTSYLNPEMINSDVNGSYTGVTRDTYFEDVLEVPEQDADDL